MSMFVIPGKLPGANDYIKACRGNKRVAAKIKGNLEEIIVTYLLQSGIKPIDKAVCLHYTWYEPNQRRDKDNIAFAAKFIQDAMIKAGILKNDGWREVDGFSHDFKVDRKNPRVVVEIKVVE